MVLLFTENAANSSLTAAWQQQTVELAISRERVAAAIQWSGFDVRHPPAANAYCERQIQSSTRINSLLVVL
jgi:hypothetical protein